MFTLQEALKSKIPTYYRILKYLISGGTSAVVTIGILYILTHVFGLWYLLSTVVGYLVGFIVSFTLQKFWTFENSRVDQILSQAPLYFCIVLGNLGLNTLGMYILVEKFHMGYILADILVLGAIAIESYFLYKIVFRNR